MGGKSLQKFGYDLSCESIGECWDFGSSKWDECCKEGHIKENPLNNYGEMRSICLENTLREVSVINKNTDANKDLSVQVHPNDEFAKVYENGELGKTECWYIIDCKEDAQLVYGHNAYIKSEFEEMVNDGNWDDLLRKVSIKPGDFFYVPSGTIHALCEGQ